MTIVVYLRIENMGKDRRGKQANMNNIPNDAEIV